MKAQIQVLALGLQSPRIPVAAYLAGHLPTTVRLCLGSFPEKELVLSSHNNGPLCSTWKSWNSDHGDKTANYLNPLPPCSSAPSVKPKALVSSPRRNWDHWTLLFLFPTHWLDLCFSLLLASLIDMLGGWLNLLGPLEPVTFPGIFIFSLCKGMSSVFCFFRVCVW